MKSTAFTNTSCPHYPCHEGLAELNCLFCYCPLYSLGDCPGTPEPVEKNGRTFKSCANCVFPHKPENQPVIEQLLKEHYCH